MKLRGALFWMSCFLSCHRDGVWIERTMNLYYDRPRGGLTVSKRETSTDPGRGLVARISDDYEPQFPVAGEDLPCPAARDVVDSRVGAVRSLETVNQRSRVVGNSFRLSCSDSDDSDDDVLSVGLNGL